jgi:hypothetical protein
MNKYEEAEKAFNSIFERFPSRNLEHYKREAEKVREALQIARESEWQPIENLINKEEADTIFMQLWPEGGYWSEELEAWCTFSRYYDCDIKLDRQPTHFRRITPPSEEE